MREHKLQFHFGRGELCSVSEEVKGSDTDNNDNNYNHADVISCSADKAPRNQLSPRGVLRITPEGPLEFLWSIQVLTLQSFLSTRSTHQAVNNTTE